VVVEYVEDVGVGVFLCRSTTQRNEWRCWNVRIRLVTVYDRITMETVQGMRHEVEVDACVWEKEVGTGDSGKGCLYAN
jgi:hypothetical protein